MNKRTPLTLMLCLFAALGCQQKNAAYWYAEGDRLEAASKNKRLAYSFEDFVASPDYCNSRDMWRGAAIELYDPQNSVVEVLLNEQRGRLYIRGQIAMDFPVCSGRVGGKETPKGTFRISQKVKDYASNAYGSFVNADGKVVESNVAATDPIPAKAPLGTHFKGAEMPYWMRFNGAIGLHVGNVHRTSASHGCVRVPEEACSILFSKLAVGSKVIVR